MNVTAICFICIVFCLAQIKAKSCGSCDLKEEYSVSLVENGVSVPIESAQIDSKRNAILLSTRSTNEIIRIDSRNGNILDQPYIANIQSPRGSAVINDLFYVASSNTIRVYDINENNAASPQYINAIIPESTLNNHQYNGLCTTPDNQYLYVTDPGFSFVTRSDTGTGGIWKIHIVSGVIEEILALGTTLRPNGCAVDNDGNLFFAANPNIGQVYVYDAANDEIKLLNLNGINANPDDTGIDGLVVDENDNLFISENKVPGKEIFQINLNSFLHCILDLDGYNECDPNALLQLKSIPISLDNPADLGYDANKNYLLVPSFNRQSVENFAVYKIKCK